MAIRRIPLPWTTVYANSTSVRDCPAGPALGAARIKKMRVVFELQGNTGLTVGAGYQTADHEDTWSSSTGIGSTGTSDGMRYPSAWVDVSANTGAATLFRVVWRSNNSSGSAVNLARVGGVLEIDDT